MPRKVTVAVPPKEPPADASTFPQPPDPTGQNSHRSRDVQDDSAASTKDPPPREELADFYDVAAGGNRASQQQDPATPSLRAGFLPPAPHGVQNDTANAADEEKPAVDDTGGWPVANEEAATPTAPPHGNQPPYSGTPHGQHSVPQAHHQPAAAAYSPHDGAEAWHDWHQQQQHSPWHHYGHHHAGYHQQWWGHQHYYDDHYSQHPQQPHAQAHGHSSQQPNHASTPTHHGREQQQQHYPSYQEFMPPMDNNAPKHSSPDASAHKQPGKDAPAPTNHPPPHHYGYYHHHPPPAYHPPPPNPQDAKSKQRPKEIDRRLPPSHGMYPPIPPLAGWATQQQHATAHYKAREQMIQQQAEAEKMPTYAYSDAFQHKSWNDMVAMWNDFQQNHLGVDIEQFKDDGDNSSSLILVSWIREVRWIRRARAPDDEKSPKATRGRDKPQSFDAFPPLPDSITLNPPRIEELNTINFPWKQDRSSWQKWLDDLLHFRAKSQGDMNVPLKYTEYPSLGNFVNRQRTEYRKLLQGKNSSMTQSKIADLNRVGFLWSVREGGHTSWDTRLMELRDYQIQNGHCNVPKLYKPNPSLGYWVNEQRFQYRRMMNNKPSYMTEVKVAHLNALGFVWTLRESKKPWEDWLEELRAYKAIHGHVDVPLKYEKNVPLGAFVNNQRSEYRKLHKGENSSMTPAKIRDLEEMGFHWSVRESRTPWTTRLKELREYKAEFGNVDVPTGWGRNPSLSFWVEKQRQQYKLFGRAPCHLTKERVDALNALGFDWKGSTVEAETKHGGVEEGKREMMKMEKVLI